MKALTRRKQLWVAKRCPGFADGLASILGVQVVPSDGSDASGCSFGLVYVDKEKKIMLARGEIILYKVECSLTAISACNV